MKKVIMRAGPPMVVLAFVIMAGSQQAKPKGKSFDGFSLVDKTGNIRKPADYRGIRFLPVNG